ncbi:MAG: hypothetical protein JHC87_08965, partial [Thermoleophilaceae bacterium]|nr:hypothetical protein [Thermoleophilaceae bacterium]
MAVTSPLSRPGVPKMILWSAYMTAFGFALVIALRYLAGFDPVVKWEPMISVMLITAPLGFLYGTGVFDYWIHWASGRPTQPDDHSDHGAKSLRDYFRANTDHKVIGIQYIITTFFFFFLGGLLALVFRA